MTNDASPGPLEQTGNPMDLAIDGQGYFVVQTGDGALRYTRDGSFKVDGNGRIVTSGGLLLRLDGLDGSQVGIPPEARELTVDAVGVVTCVTRDDSEPIVLGRIRIGFPLPAASGRTPAMLPIGGILSYMRKDYQKDYQKGDGQAMEKKAVHSGFLYRTSLHDRAA